MPDSMQCVSRQRPARAYIALGSNLGDSSAQVLRAFHDLDALPGTRLLCRSSLYRSAPVGYLDQPAFINAVAEIETRLQPHDLLEALLQLEQRRGRVRGTPNGPRTLDLDILLYEGLHCHDAGLTLPHPRMHERAFVLKPLLEIAPECVIPDRGRAAEWIARCAGQIVEVVSDKEPLRACAP